MNLPPCPYHWQTRHQARKHAKLRAATSYPEPFDLASVGAAEPPPAPGVSFLPPSAKERLAMDEP